MKKWCMMILAALCLVIPVVSSAQGLPDFLQAVQSGLSEGLAASSAAMLRHPADSCAEKCRRAIR